MCAVKTEMIPPCCYLYSNLLISNERKVESWGKLMSIHKGICKHLWKITTFLKPYPHQASSISGSGSGSVIQCRSWWRLKISPRPIPKRHHWPALDDTVLPLTLDTRCGYTLKFKIRSAEYIENQSSNQAAQPPLPPASPDCRYQSQPITMKTLILRVPRQPTRTIPATRITTITP